MNILSIFNPPHKRLARKLTRRATDAFRDSIETLLQMLWNSIGHRRSLPPLKGSTIIIRAYPALKRWAMIFRPASGTGTCIPHRIAAAVSVNAAPAKPRSTVDCQLPAQSANANC